MGSVNPKSEVPGAENQGFFANAKLQWAFWGKKASESVHDLGERTRHQLAETPGQLRKGWAGLIQRAQSELGCALREDLQQVNGRIDALTERVSELTRQLDSAKRSEAPSIDELQRQKTQS